MRDPWRLAALALGASLAWQFHRAQRAEAALARCKDAGQVDLDPVLDHIEGALGELALAGGVRLTSTSAHCSDRPALRVLP